MYHLASTCNPKAAPPSGTPTPTPPYSKQLSELNRSTSKPRALLFQYPPTHQPTHVTPRLHLHLLGPPLSRTPAASIYICCLTTPPLLTSPLLFAVFLHSSKSFSATPPSTSTPALPPYDDCTLLVRLVANPPLRPHKACSLGEKPHSLLQPKTAHHISPWQQHLPRAPSPQRAQSASVS